LDQANDLNVLPHNDNLFLQVPRMSKKKPLKANFAIADLNETSFLNKNDMSDILTADETFLSFANSVFYFISIVLRPVGFVYRIRFRFKFMELQAVSNEDNLSSLYEVGIKEVNEGRVSCRTLR
jgi:hypothetical protein